MKKNPLIKFDCAKKGLMSLILFSLLPLFLLACGGHSSSLSLKKISNKLLPPIGDQIYFGANPGFGGSEDNVTGEIITGFDQLSKKPAAWSYFANNWSLVDYSSVPDIYSPEIKYPREKISVINAAGKVPFIRLLPWSNPNKTTASVAVRRSKGIDIVAVCTDTSVFPFKLSKFIDSSERQEHLDAGASDGLCSNDFSMQNIIDGKWDDDLRQWIADYQEDLDENGNTIPLLMTFAPEMNGYWFPWGGIHHGGAKNTYKPEDGLADGPERYRDAFRHIIDLFKEEGASKTVTWFFAPDPIGPNQTWMSYLNEDWNTIKNYYPGDTYIDWIGFTLYGPAHDLNNWSVFSEDLAERSKQISDINSSKPIALLETGAMDLNSDTLSVAQKSTLIGKMGNHTKSEWFEDFFETVLNNSDFNIKAISYWNDNWTSGEYSVNLRIGSSPESLETFRLLINNPRFTSELQFEP